MTVPRRHFHDELKTIEQELVSMADMAERAVGRAVDALVRNDIVLAGEVIDQDQLIDEKYLLIHAKWLETMALQTPVAIDLRLMSSILHLLVTLERMGDQAANIAKIVKAIDGHARETSILELLREMGDLVQPMVRTAMDAFVKRDLETAMDVPDMDEPVNRLNRSMAQEVARCAPDRDVLQWAVPMLMVSRALERVGDQAVDIAEQVAFLLTGEFQEFTRPEAEFYDY